MTPPSRQGRWARGGFPWLGGWEVNWWAVCIRKKNTRHSFMWAQVIRAAVSPTDVARCEIGSLVTNAYCDLSSYTIFLPSPFLFFTLPAYHLICASFSPQKPPSHSLSSSSLTVSISHQTSPSFAFLCWLIIWLPLYPVLLFSAKVFQKTSKGLRSARPLPGRKILCDGRVRSVPRLPAQLSESLRLLLRRAELLDVSSHCRAHPSIMAVRS